MDWKKIRANHDERKGRSGDIAEEISRSLKINYDALSRDCADTRALLIDPLVSRDGFKREEAEAIAGFGLRALKAVIAREYEGKTASGKIPYLAAELVSAALDVLAEALPNGRTLRAYRNRHDDFINTMAVFAERVSGDKVKHASFYEELGRQVAVAVLEHELAPDLHPAPIPNEIHYQAIADAALGQLVYFIGAGEAGPIKIGIASNPQARLSTLQTAHHEELKILALTAGGRERELAYHGAFARRRLKGEWFERCPEIEAEIARLAHP